MFGMKNLIDRHTKLAWRYFATYSPYPNAPVFLRIILEAVVVMHSQNVRL